MDCIFPCASVTCMHLCMEVYICVGECVGASGGQRWMLDAALIMFHFIELGFPAKARICQFG